MVYSEGADGRRGLVSVSRVSKLPRWVPRKSSQSSTRGPEIANASDQEARSRKDTTKYHQRDSSITSQESYDISTPSTPLSTHRLSPSKGNTPRESEDGQPSFANSERPSRRPKSVTIATPTDPSFTQPSSHLPRSSGTKGSASRQFVRRTCSFKIPADLKMADQVDDKPKSTGPTSNQTSKPLPNSQPDSGAMFSREDSYVQVNGIPSQSADEQASAEDPSIRKTNGSRGKKSAGLGGDRLKGVIANTSGLESSWRGKSNQADRDDDDSLPDLDDMEVPHVLPPRSPNGGIRWAPWNVPFRRRGQTLVVLMHSLSIVATVSLFFSFCANPFAWPLLLIYLLHVLSSKAATDGSLKYRSEWIRKSYIWNFFADYYPARLHKTHDLPETRKYIFGYHPHGIISHGAWAAFATDALGFSTKFPGITNSLLTLDSNFRIPFYREYILSMGVRSVSKESIVNILNKGGPNGEGMGRAVTVVVGGARESLEAQPGMMRLVLRERKGFIKLAVRCGADLVPVLAFGENDLYDQLQPQEHPFMHSIQMFILKVWKFTLPFLHGRGIFNYDVGLMPYRRPLNVVVGAPIKVRQSHSVDMEEINRLHSLYIAELEKLWDRYKDEFAPDRKEEMQILP
ncbi:putative diacylglycerol acyltransferase [Rosellinia necatrix]|uniref:diacylglycerol O-acyltransferase n=1 Tax=Rosellinia necatrix TaxID=77044 RepID=A0A1W2TB15_ROSNE|nr:putative diacylglycerol acyltransferase [Rosellinia necatrix]